MFCFTEIAYAVARMNFKTGTLQVLLVGCVMGVT